MTPSGDPDHSRPFERLVRLSDANLTPEERIREAIDVGRGYLGVANGVLSYTAEGRYEVIATNIESGPYAEGGVVELDATWCRHVADGGGTIGFADAAEGPYRDDRAREATGLRCYVGAPVEIDGETYGTLCFSDPEPRADPIADEERDFVSVLADWVGHELERGKHYAELRAQNDRLDEFTGIIAHDLRNPLAGAIGFTELAQEGTTGETAAFLSRVRSALGRMETMIAECLILAKEGADVGERDEVDLEALVRDAWETVRTRNATLSVDVDPGTTVLADAERLQRLLENLFRNSVEHGGSDVSVTVSGDDHGFVVADDGPGLPPAVEAALADADAENVKSFGLGLLVVLRVVSGHSWDLAVDTSADGTAFRVSDLNAAEPVHEELDD
ncbi:GAF domain-containing sensor histidine kinase [Halorubrum rubrum]|uniref:histidine kinase n=1 Tax=Halorubrum rubrum TaxID=1126240 RepID=A0ABD5R4P5_9EURY|nr:GAF domain-containing sensor histidine kinase [Halorubrum rubrum]